MKAGLVVAGVLSLGTGVVFGAAAATASMFPNGATVQAGGMDQSQVVWALNGRLIGAGIKARGPVIGGPVPLNGPNTIFAPAPPLVVTR